MLRSSAVSISHPMVPRAIPPRRRPVKPGPAKAMLGAAALLLGAVLGPAPLSAAGYSVIATFAGAGAGGDAAVPYGGLVMDATGRLYGATYYGGNPNCTGSKTYGCGAIFMLIPPAKAGGAWKKAVIHRFQDGNDGGYPYGGLAVDAAGALYGTTYYGGTSSEGVLFKLTPNKAKTHWTETVLHNFGSIANDGVYPSAPLTLSAQGVLFGTTYEGGTHSLGTVFALRLPTKAKPLAYFVLYSFAGGTSDGEYPASYGTGPAVAPSGEAVYGTTEYGGASDEGTVFALTRTGNGPWSERVIHSFSGSDGGYPEASVILDKQGRLYGTTYEGGPNSYGAVFMLTPQKAPAESPVTILKSFNEYNGYVYSGLAMDKSGALYGMTYYGGVPACYDVIYGCGTVFKLVKNGSVWNEAALHRFLQFDGAFPENGLLVSGNGTLYGLTVSGGNGCEADDYGCGTAFEIKP